MCALSRKSWSGSIYRSHPLLAWLDSNKLTERQTAFESCLTHDGGPLAGKRLRHLGHVLQTRPWPCRNRCEITARCVQSVPIGRQRSFWTRALTDRSRRDHATLRCSNQRRSMLSLWTSVLSLAPATDTAMLRAEAWTRPTGLKKVGGILLPPLPDSGKQIVVSQDAGVFGGTGGRVWPAASALVRWQLRNPNLVQGSSVLELGAGCGACGLFAAGMGASNVMLTDANRHCCELMTDSASVNGLGAVNAWSLSNWTRYRTVRLI